VDGELNEVENDGKLPVPKGENNQQLQGWYEEKKFILMKVNVE